MSYILSSQRDLDCNAAFIRYEKYLKDHQTDCPESAYKYATSDWWYDFENHRCPHDAWLEDLQIIERSSGDRHQVRWTDISIRLLGAYHDGIIELTYKNVKRYDIQCDQDSRGDWRYDQFTGLGTSFRHEIEWDDGVIWSIEAEELIYTWQENKTNQANKAQ